MGSGGGDVHKDPDFDCSSLSSDPSGAETVASLNKLYAVLQTVFSWL
jgi:hypothetical protein